MPPQNFDYSSERNYINNTSHRIALENHPERVSRLTHDDTTTDRQVNCEYNIAAVHHDDDIDDTQFSINKDDDDEIKTERNQGNNFKPLISQQLPNSRREDIKELVVQS